MTDPQASELGARLEEHFRDIHLRCMKDVPICNEALSVAALGFQPFGDWTLGIVLCYGAVDDGRKTGSAVRGGLVKVFNVAYCRFGGE
jgi:hypothetical protein